MSEPIGSKRFWNVRQAAAYILVNPRHIYTLVRKATKDAQLPTAKRKIKRPIPYRRLGRNIIRFPVESFKRWADTPDHEGFSDVHS